MVMVAMTVVETLNHIPNGNTAGQLSKHHGNQLCPTAKLSNSLIAIVTINDLLELVARNDLKQMVENAVMMLVFLVLRNSCLFNCYFIADQQGLALSIIFGFLTGQQRYKPTLELF